MDATTPRSETKLKTLGDAAVTARTVKDLAALLERQPDALIRGKGAPQEKR